MIQRIQTIYLLIAAILLLVVQFFPLAEILSTSGQSFVLDTNDIADNSGTTIVNTLPIAILYGLTALISFVTIFMFKRRMLQKRLGIYNIIVILSSAGLLYFFPYHSEQIVAKAVAYEPYAFVPLVAIGFIIQANRAIQRDEKLVRSADRIR